MANLTPEMIEHLNQTLESKGVFFRYEFISDYDPHAILAEIDHPWIYSADIVLSDRFFAWLQRWFKTNYGIELLIHGDDYNPSTIWAV